MSDGQREVSMDKDHEIPTNNRATQTYLKRGTKASRGKQKEPARARERERERERRFIHYLTSICTVLHPR
jgi:hypothetical protein